MHKHSQCTVVEIYELTGKHTYCLMAITIAGILVSLVGLVALYNKLGPRPLSVEIQASNCVPSIEQEKTAGMLIKYHVAIYVFIMFIFSRYSEC